MTWDWVARSIRAGNSFLCLGEFFKKGEKNRQKSLNSKVEEMQKLSSKIPEEFNMQEGALMPWGRYSLNWPRGEARPSGFRSFRYTKALVSLIKVYERVGRYEKKTEFSHRFLEIKGAVPSK